MFELVVDAALIGFAAFFSMWFLAFAIDNDWSMELPEGILLVLLYFIWGLAWALVLKGIHLIFTHQIHISIGVQ